MIVALPVNVSNHALANKWFDQCAKLGGIQNTELLLLAPANLQFPPSHTLWKVNRIKDRSSVSGFPFQLNSAFVQLAWNCYFAKRESPWLLCDPAFVPVDSYWLSRLESAYAEAGKAFLVEMVPGAAGEPSHPRPLCILPADAIRQSPDSVSERRPRLPWYIRGLHELTPKKVAETKLFSELFVPTESLFEPSAGTKPVLPDKEASPRTEAPTAVPVYSMSELCEVILHNVKSETARKRLMEFLLEHKFHRKDFGTPTTEMVNAQ